jgi:AraC family transcriptional regulator of adaptative response/methylated-DNA-[protein]-cysteine methyltransferase
VAHRAKKVRAELADRKGSVTSAIYGAGFNSNSRFYERANEVLGMTPTAYKRGGKDAEIRFAVGQCSLGAILVARSNKGICAITLGDDPDALVRSLQDCFPNANLIGGDREFEKLVAQVVGFVEAPRIGLDLPLDVRGTAFQQRVWQALRERHAVPTRSPWPFPVTASSRATARPPVIAGACNASARCSRGRPRHERARQDHSRSAHRTVG